MHLNTVKMGDPMIYTHTHTHTYMYVYVCFLTPDSRMGFSSIGIRERKGQRQKHQRERNIDRQPSSCTPTGVGTRDLGMCPDWGVKPAAFQGMGRRSNQLMHSARACVMRILPQLKKKLGKSVQSHSCLKKSVSVTDLLLYA